LPFGLWIIFRQGFHQAHAGIGNKKPDFFQTSFFEVLQETGPAGLVFFGTFCDTKDFTKALIINANGNQYRDITYFSGPGAFQDDAIKINIREFTNYWSVSPGFNIFVNFLRRHLK